METLITPTDGTPVCQQCQCTQFSIIKKGFSGVEAVTGFVVILALVGLALYITISNEHTDYTASTTNYAMIRSILVTLGGILPFLGLLAGTNDMNKLYRICHHCGQKTEVGSLKVKVNA